MRNFKKLLATTILSTTLILGFMPIASAAFNPNVIMDDVVFDATNSMNAQGIDSWINQTFGSASCISTSHGFSAPDPTGYSPTPTSHFTYGNNVTAGQVIADAAQAYGINPQVLLATMQKEQSLVTGSAGCGVLAYTGAMGYGCPDSGTTHNYSGVDLYSINGTEVTSVNGTCVSSAAQAGFSEQVIHAAWLLRFGEQRSEGNIGWDVQLTNAPQPGDSWDNSDDPQSCYGGPMTQGTWARCPSGGSAYYDGSYTIDNTSVQIGSGATAALYWYTPHFSGNQNFYNIFTSWFGGTISASYYSCHNASNVSGATSGAAVVRDRLGAGQPDHLTFTELNNTGSACVEAHIWNSGYQSMLSDTATQLPAFNPLDSQVLSGDFYNNGQDELIFVDYMNTGSGRIEIHIWSPTAQQFLNDYATNLPCAPTTDGQIIAGDLFGNGKTELAYAKYQNTGSGKVEIHIWNSNLTNFVNDYATNVYENPPDIGQVVAANLGGSGPDSLMYVVYQNSGSGKVEVHVWSPGYQRFVNDYATNVYENPPDIGQVVAANLGGSGPDSLMYVVYQNSGSGKVEVHVWSPGYQRFVNDYATNVYEITNN